MKKSTVASKGRSLKKQTRLFRAVIFAIALLVVGMITAIARYEARKSESKMTASQNISAPALRPNFVTVAAGGKKLQVNAQTLQQGPLTQDQAQQIADALKDNKSTDGLVQVQNPDGSVSVDLQGRFQNVMLAKKNTDGSVDQACVDNSEAASAFLQSKDSTNPSPQGTGRRAVVKE
jgi:hypothetical protein